LSDPVRLVSESEWQAVERVIDAASLMTDTGHGRWDEDVARAITRWRQLTLALAILKNVRKAPA
jgi:hypothetical protein